MKAFVDLSIEDQASVVLTTLLDDVAHNRRTMAGIQHHMGDLYNLLSEHFDVSIKEVQKVTEAVAKYGIRMLPGYKEEDTDGGTEGGGVEGRADEAGERIEAEV